MNIQITGRHLEITEELNTYINDKFAKLAKHFDHITNCHAVVSKDKVNFTAEAEVHVAGSNMFAQSTESSAYAAVDTLINKLDRQVIKHKEKLTDHNTKRFEFKTKEEAEVDLDD